MSQWPRRWLPAVMVGVALFGSGLAAGRALHEPATEVNGRTRIATGRDQRQAEGSPSEAAGHTRPSERHSRSRDGAIEAAAAYAVTFDGLGLLDPARRTELLDRYAARGSRDEVAGVLGDVADLLALRLGIDSHDLDDPGFVWRVVPAGWQVHSYDEEHAVVAVWATGVVIVNGRPLVQPGWHTTEVELAWERGDWRLVGFQSESGPQPPTLGADAGAASRARLIEAFRPFHHLPIESPSPAP